MKPTRGLPDAWFGSIPRERRMALVSIAVLLALLGAIVLYQQYQVPLTPLEQPEPQEAPPAAASPAEPASPAAAPQAAPPSPAAQPAASTPDPTPTRLSSPLTGKAEVVKLYESMDEAYGDLRHYHGIAYATAPGHSVMAAADGVIEMVENDPADGLTVTIRHSPSLSTRYSSLGEVLVKEGQQVEEGTVIAETGEPTEARAAMGPHLAFQVWRDGEPIDPAVMLPQ